MPSELIGMRRKLTWADFSGNPTAQELQRMQAVAAGASGKVVGIAQISSNFSVNFGGSIPADPVLNPEPGASTFELADTITVTVNFVNLHSWKRIAPLTLEGEQLLLDHEQGHYDMTALMARDCFIDLMKLKAKSYPTRAAGQAEARGIVSSYQTKLDTVQNTYDTDTIHGAWVVPFTKMLKERKESFQVKWEGFIEKAFTVERASGETTPGGIPYKRRLLDVLADGGFKI
jgi:hypothetical protein